jgi:hypothetical protein
VRRVCIRQDGCDCGSQAWRSQGKRRPGPAEETRREPAIRPVNVIFIRNAGRTPVTITRCHYVSGFGGTEFRFEPQPAASLREDHLPKRLEPGENALLIHDLATMRVFINQVLRDHGVDAAVFWIVLTLGHGTEAVTSPSLRFRADMSDEEIAVAGTRLVRQEIDLDSPFARSAHAGRWRWHRKTHGTPS